MGLFYQRGTASGAKTQNTEWFASDLTLNTSMANEQSGTWRVTFNVATSVVIQYTLDSGSTWYNFSSTDPTAAIETAFVIHASDTDTFNMRTTDGSGVTVNYCTVAVAPLDPPPASPNKTIDLSEFTLTGTKAQFDTALSDDDFAYIGQANIFTANQQVKTTGVASFTGNRNAQLSSGQAMFRIDAASQDDTTAENVIFSRIQFSMRDNDDESKDSDFIFQAMNDNTLTTLLSMRGDLLQVQVSNADLSLTGGNIVDGGVIFLQEQAEADADVAGSGQFWVDTATPNVAFFTDDAGTDFRLSFNTSAQLAAMVSDETGSSLLVFNTSPTLVTPLLGTPTSGVLTNCTGLPITGITSSTSAEFATLCSDESGSGLLVFNNSPTFITPALGTPASGVATNLTGTSGITGLGVQTQTLNMSDETLNQVGIVECARADLTIASGSVTPNRSVNRIDTEASASTDDLDALGVVVTGAIWIIHSVAGARDPTVKDSSDLRAAGDFTLDSNTDTWSSVGLNTTIMIETSRSDNA